MGFETGQPIEVYVELAGKEKYHSSLRGRDEENQHPISAITNLQDNLDSLQDEINNNKTNIEQQVNELSSCINNTIQEINNSINHFESDLSSLDNSLTNRINNSESSSKQYADNKVEALKDLVVEELDKIDLDAYYTKEETDEKLEGTFHYKGQVPEFDALPIIQNEKGDVYNVSTTGANYVWTGYAWDNLSPTICLKGYATKDYVDGTLEASIRLLQDHLQVHYYEKSEIDAKIQEIIDIGPEALKYVFIFKGHVDTESELPEINNKVGDVYLVLEDMSMRFWAGASWNILTKDLRSIESLVNDLNDRVISLEEKTDTIINDVNDVETQIDDINYTRVWHEIG